MDGMIESGMALAMMGFPHSDPFMLINRSGL